VNQRRDRQGRPLRWVTICAITLLILGLCAVAFPSKALMQTLSPFICPNATYSFDLDSNQRQIALTIDDVPDFRTDEQIGQNINTTQGILDVLNRYNARATFFLISNQVERREALLASGKKLDPLVSRIIQEGHEIGNHFTKDERSIDLGDRFEGDLLQADRVLRKYSQIPGSKYPQLSWARPGAGSCNQRMVDIAQKHGYRLALGTIWPYDTMIASSTFSTDFILRNIEPGKIIILHDSGKKGEWGYRTIATLEKVLTALTQKGYKTMPLSDLFKH
jgi:peptidoglycan-N-acetylglucosamine deacetylase